MGCASSAVSPNGENGQNNNEHDKVIGNKKQNGHALKTRQEDSSTFTERKEKTPKSTVDKNANRLKTIPPQAPGN